MGEVGSKPFVKHSNFYKLLKFFRKSYLASSKPYTCLSYISFQFAKAFKEHYNYQQNASIKVNRRIVPIIDIMYFVIMKKRNVESRMLQINCLNSLQISWGLDCVSQLWMRGRCNTTAKKYANKSQIFSDCSQSFLIKK